ncbi:murein L,D-transpeptidase catalytic domain family protein [Sphingobacterium sp. SGG-5]|uniref:murein L,D-transpeptidase catalytic domain family protein n=1 Tax=Sphingobacterium sp. SGG-5 TaxID=2710881 RepID=UPI0013ECB5BB|nr:murein L,D-transpeptidase catalytic domain family protein [Sphingobacterium sp. SGG-5]NGM61892.1 murein L,D-transpeptidase catalytic domain family protein [Sphingobacterium sp. SGG-5]
MKNIVSLLALICAAGFYTIFSQPISKPVSSTKITTKTDSIIDERSPLEILYQEIDLADKLKYEVFEMAMLGFDNLSLRNKDIITIVDFSLPSTDKRMYVIDLKNKKLLFHTIVSHGRNSGDKYATSFSNRHGSFQSSLGFYITEGTYVGGNGYSLVIDGIEKGINDQAKARAVVIHGADYCSTSFIKNTGRLGRSYGCPALPRELTKPIINTIKNGTGLFIYADNVEYMANSTLVRDTETLIAAQRPLPDITPTSATLN